MTLIEMIRSRFLLTALPLMLSSCGLDAYSLFSFSGNLNGVTPDLASEVEVDLYSDGPVDIPVTIAKLDVPDSGKITITIEYGSGQELVIPDPLFQETFLTMIIRGSAGAIDVSKTPNLVAYVKEETGVDVSSQTVIEASADGSFEIRIAVDSSTSHVVFAGVTSDLAYASSFLEVVPQEAEENGVTRRNFIIVTTNSYSIRNGMNVMADANGYYYLDMDFPAGAYTLVRRNLDGSEIQVLREGGAVSVDHVFAVSENKIATIDDSGVLSLILPSAVPLALDGGARFTLVSYETELGVLESYEKDATRLWMTGDEGSVIVNQFSALRNVIAVIKTANGTDVPIVREGWFDDVKAGYAPAENALYVTVNYEGQRPFYRVDLGGSLTTAWSQREELDDDFPLSAVTSVETYDGSIVALDGEDDSGNRVLAYWTASAGYTLLTDPASVLVYANPKPAPDGITILACRLDGDSGQLAYARIGEDPQGTFHAITVDEDYSACSENPGSYFIDADGFLHFYRSQSDGSLPQHALMNLSELE